MAFKLEYNSRYRISIGDVVNAQKHLKQKFYGANIENITIEEYDAIINYCEEFATDYWCGGRDYDSDANVLKIHQCFFYFCNKEDFDTFKLISKLYAEEPKITDEKTRREKNNKQAVQDTYVPNRYVFIYLNKLQTRKLMQMRNECYRLGGVYKIAGFDIYQDDIKFVLNRRPHINNKLESKKARQLAAKAKK